jgi:hypothetical protein
MEKWPQATENLPSATKQFRIAAVLFAISLLFYLPSH